MIKNYKVHRFLKTIKRNLSKAYLFAAVTAAVLPGSLSAQASYVFTSAGQMGPIGPTQGQLNTAYLSTNLSGSVTSVLGIQHFTVPKTGVYRIEGIGGQGGYNGGYGAQITGDFTLTAGTVLKILVGQEGTSDINFSYFIAGGGGGGSYVTDINDNILLIAGGGGGNGDGYIGVPINCCSTTMEAALTVNGNGNPYPAGSNGGVGGNGGNCGPGSSAGGGGGFTTNGAQCGSSSEAQSFLNGGEGGWNGGNYTGDGGFGGGGGCYNTGTGQRGGGGGGYSGGGGGIAQNNQNDAAGGGGGYKNNGLNQINIAGSQSGGGQVTITELCIMSVVASQNPLCAGNTLTLTASSVGSISWQPGGATVPTIFVTPAVTTTYVASGTGTVGANTCAIALPIVVKISPLPVITPMVYPTLLCVGDAATLTASGANTYTWSTNAQGDNTTVSPNLTTVYTVTGTSTFGCKNTETVGVNVNTNVLGGTSNTAVCRGKSITLNAIGGVSYVWNGMIPFPSMIVTPTAAAVYTVNAIDANECPLSRTVSVGINENPVPQVTSDLSTVCIGEPFMLTASGTGINTFTWSNGAGGPTLAVTPTVDIIYMYTVSGSDNNGCVGTNTVSVEVSRCIGLSETNASNNGGVFPNPTNGLFTITIPNAFDNVNIKVYNALGSLVKTQKVTSSESKINIENEPNGLYLVHLVKGDKSVQISKIVKQ